MSATPNSVVRPAVWSSLALLLSINLFNYIDRQVLSAVLPKLQLDAELFSPSDPLLKTKLGSLTTAFMLSYMLLSPVFGRLADYMSRWVIVGGAVILWSLASGASGLAISYLMLLMTRCLVGVGEAAYGPVAPAMLSDLFPERRRGLIMSIFYMAIPVGSALGFVVGGQIAETSWGWRGAFQVVVLPGVVLGIVCFFMREPPRQRLAQNGGLREYFRVLRNLVRIRSFRFNTIAMTASTFAIGGIASWMPFYIFDREARFVLDEPAIVKLSELKATDGTPVVAPEVIEKLSAIAGPEEAESVTFSRRLEETLTRTEMTLYDRRIYEAATTPDSPSLGRVNLIFGAIVVVSGLGATIGGGLLGDYLRQYVSGAYFLVAGGGTLLGLPFFVALLFVPFPYAWLCIGLAVFCLFLNTGPANAILANVVHSGVRATAFAINILIIHAFGDAISPMIIGSIADVSNLRTAFLIVGGMIAISGVIWLLGMPYLRADTDAVESTS